MRKFVMIILTGHTLLKMFFNYSKAVFYIIKYKNINLYTSFYLSYYQTTHACSTV